VRRTAVWCGAPTACLKSRNHHSKITAIFDIAVARRPTLFIIEIKENTECLWKLFSAKLKSAGDVRPVHLPGRWTTSTTRGCRNRVRARALSDQYTGWWHEQPAGMVPYGQGRRHRGADYVDRPMGCVRNHRDGMATFRKSKHRRIKTSISMLSQRARPSVPIKKFRLLKADRNSSQ
jgi:hypothetical protein